MVQVKFTTFGANTAFGSFAPGETLRCSEALAKHLVDEIRCAKYVEAPKVDSAGSDDGSNVASEAEVEITALVPADGQPDLESKSRRKGK